MTEQIKEFDQQRQNLLLFIWKKRKSLTILTAIGAIASIVISFLITPLFKSTAVVFPAATSTVSFSEQRNANASSMDFGEEEQAEQLIQILQSSRIRNRIVDHFDLYNHYEISQEDINKNYKLAKAYDSHVTFTRTRYGSIQIDVLDEDRELAAKIVNKIVELIDTVKNNMIHERTIPAFQINKRMKNILDTELQEIQSKLDSLSEIGVVSIEGRANIFQAYIEAKQPEDRVFFKNQIDVNLKYGATFDGLEKTRSEKLGKLSRMKDSYDQSESDANTLFNHKFIVENAVVADKKDKPKRMIIVLVATLATFLFALFTLLISERIKELKTQV